MELITQLKQDGIAKGLCRLWQGKLKPGLSVGELARLYIDGIDFCISEDYPTLPFLREHFKGKCEEYGVFIDDELMAHNKPSMVLNGACKAMVDCDEYSVSNIYIRHTSKASVTVSGNAIATIDLFDKAELFLSVVNDGKAIVNVYGDEARLTNCTPSNGNIKVIKKERKTY